MGELLGQRIGIGVWLLVLLSNDVLALPFNFVRGVIS